MKLENFLENDFSIFQRDGVSTMVISTNHIIKSHNGLVDQKNPPKEKSLEVLKKSFYDEVLNYLDLHGVDGLLSHPAKFMREFGKDLALKGRLKKEYWSYPTIFLEECSLL